MAHCGICIPNATLRFGRCCLLLKQANLGVSEHLGQGNLEIWRDGDESLLGGERWDNIFSKRAPLTSEHSDEFIFKADLVHPQHRVD